MKPHRVNHKARAEFYKKAINLIKRHGHVIIYFSDRDGYMRRRKLTVTARCYVQHFGALSGVWQKHYAMSCFMMCGRAESVSQMFRTMNVHDIEDGIHPLMMEWGKGRTKKRMEFNNGKK